MYLYPLTTVWSSASAALHEHEQRIVSHTFSFKLQRYKQPQLIKYYLQTLREQAKSVLASAEEQKHKKFQINQPTLQQNEEQPIFPCIIHLIYESTKEKTITKNPWQEIFFFQWVLLAQKWNASTGSKRICTDLLM